MNEMRNRTTKKKTFIDHQFLAFCCCFAKSCFNFSNNCIPIAPIFWGHANSAKKEWDGFAFEQIREHHFNFGISLDSTPQIAKAV